VPRGVVGVITPWNWPYEMPAEVIAPALASGNAVVWAPAPSTSICAIKLAECLVDAGLPEGLLNLITGPGPVVGDEIAHNRGTHAIAFIGSIATGHKVAERAAGKELLIEMGGNGPTVILDDADLDQAVTATLAGCFLCAGQSCTAGERILVHRAVRDEFVDLLARRVAERILLGNPFDDATTMGPVNNEPVAAKMDEHVTDAVGKGATLVCGGQRLTGEQYDAGTFFAPTVLTDVTPEMVIYREETFGPIAPVIIFDDEDEVIKMANDTDYGLAAYLYTNDISRAIRVSEALRFAIVGVNDINPTSAAAPFGGMKESGLGREGGQEGIVEYLETKLVGISV